MLPGLLKDIPPSDYERIGGAAIPLRNTHLAGDGRLRWGVGEAFFVFAKGAEQMG